MKVSTLKKCESLEATLSRVEEEARGIGKVQTMVEKVVVGAGDSLRRVVTRATTVGTMMEVVGDPIGPTARQWVLSVLYPSHLALRLWLTV